jgi:dihydropteroate synthase
MGIINLTPDSFGTPPSTLESSLKEAEEQVKAGVHVLDLGGMSTAPGAADVSEEEEIQRVVPFVKALRATEWGKTIPLSIDTFRAGVARAALTAGANWINDVKAGSHEGNGAMWALAKETGAPIILMHSRGDAQTMNTLAKYEGDAVKVVEQELLARVEEALEHGVRRWQIIIDPGIGFAKDAETNWQLLGRLEEYTREGPLADYPCLVGTSRKRFLGTLVDQPDPVKRDMATAATCMEAIRAGAQIVRVHNPAFMLDAIKVADKLYRS